MLDKNMQNDETNKLKSKRDYDFEEEEKLKKRKRIHSYIEDFKDFDSESTLPEVIVSYVY